MKNRIKSLVQLTANFSHTNESWRNVSNLNINQRISYRGTKFAKEGEHVKFQFNYWDKILSKAEREINYECRCLENNIRPYNYPDNLWEEHLRECAHEEHTNRCENKNAWMYQY